MRKFAHDLAKNDAGAAAVEFALIVPLLLLMILGVTELGQIVHQRSVLDSAARAGTQAAFSATLTTSGGRTAAETAMTTAANDAFNNGLPGDSYTFTSPTPEITCECSDGSACSTFTCVTGSVRYIAKVEMSKSYTPLFNLANLPGGFSLDLTMTLTGLSEMWVK